MSFRARVATAAGLLLLVALPAPASASRADWLALSREIAHPWPDLQRDSGVLPDLADEFRHGRSTGTTRYGEAMMGYAMLQVGVRDDNRRLVNAGLRSVGYAVGIGRSVSWPRPSVFETMSVAAAYNLARRRLPRHRVFHRQRGRWAAWLRRVRTVRLHGKRQFGNHWLAEAVAVVEMMRTGLRSRRRGTVLGSGRRRARRAAIRVFVRGVARLLPRRRALVLSDPPDRPIAYHSLSYALYARGLVLLGKRTPGAARLLRRLGNASLLLEAPDGDVAWAGRSQSHAWTLSATAYGASVTERRASSGRRRWSDLRQRVLRRLRSAYAIGRRGLDMVPAIAISEGRASRGLDHYAGTPAMNGLTLILLNWTLQELPRRLRHAAPARPRRATRILSQGSGRVAVIRRPDLWYAVKSRPSPQEAHRRDLRYDSGLVAAKRREGGEWHDIVPLRPRTAGRRGASAGPVLRRAGRRGVPTGRRIRASRSGSVTVSGWFSTYRGRRLRRMVLRYRTVRCGVELRFRGRRGERYRLSGFFSGRPRRTSRTIEGARNRLTLNRPFRVRFERRYVSAVDPDLVRARLAFRLARTQVVRARFC